MSADPTTDDELRRRQLDGLDHMDRQAEKRERKRDER